MIEVRIPFLRQFREPMLSGEKTWTSRTRKFGDVGDTFPAFGATFQITQVMKLTLGQVAFHGFSEEGFATEEDFVECWNKIHPRKGFISDAWVWVHVFKKVKE